MHYKYDIESKRMVENVDFFDNTKKMPEAEIDEIPKIKEYLEKNNISIKDLKETADELLYEKVIGDWEKYANSRYSKDNLGTVKIERSPLFDGVD
ncbi:TipC family immunity protein [Parvimonas sp. M20]|uniref:TipC family immunity protein n=1 Tax=Parvimonas sp. M20 TaxID=3110693 RepID=UPI002B475047|nr:TipC family immunity protein [Parvimonas sp. M20]MEB3089539.1 TipC family immunity protein [Parvimonas sp. M20]